MLKFEKFKWVLILSALPLILSPVARADQKLECYGGGLITLIFKDSPKTIDYSNLRTKTESRLDFTRIDSGNQIYYTEEAAGPEFDIDISVPENMPDTMNFGESVTIQIFGVDYNCVKVDPDEIIPVG